MHALQLQTYPTMLLLPIFVFTMCVFECVYERVGVSNSMIIFCFCFIDIAPFICGKKRFIFYYSFRIFRLVSFKNLILFNILCLVVSEG